ncbi:MAG: AEC family transporter, partial [Victivallales bacterium]|nr:AEC family transporter [Victivallales bacterium]
PPICASFIGWTIGLTPLRRLFVGVGAPLGVIIDTMKLLADAVFPCALLVMGGILADPPPKNEQIRWNTVTAMVITKLLLLPAFGILFVTFLWKHSLIPQDGLCALVLMVEAAVPPANNLIIMSQSLNKGESSMARLLIWAYMLAVPSLTIWIFFYLTLIQSWMK